MNPLFSRKIKDFFRSQAGVVLVYVFGSFAKGEENSESDLDVAVLFDSKKVPDYSEVIELREQLASKLKISVDLVILNQANPILKHQILQSGQLLFKDQSSALGDFFARSITEYADLKRVRAPIEKAILKGRVYG